MANEDTSLTIPTVHLNGSGFQNLERQYSAAYEALIAAREALPAPHGRDYYVQDDGAFERARAQFQVQIMKLSEVEEEIKTILHGIFKQQRE